MELVNTVVRDINSRYGVFHFVKENGIISVSLNETKIGSSEEDIDIESLSELDLLNFANSLKIEEDDN